MLRLGLLLFLKLLSLAFILYSVVALFLKMSLVKQKVDRECRVFQDGPFPIFYRGDWNTCMFGSKFQW